jgi:hypothetical protein
MRTTVDLDDNLFRRAKAQAATEGIALKDLFEQGVRLALEKRNKKARTRDLTIPIFKAKSSKILRIPADVVHRMDELEDRERHEASLRR